MELFQQVRAGSQQKKTHQLFLLNSIHLYTYVYIIYSIGERAVPLLMEAKDFMSALRLLSSLRSEKNQRERNNIFA